MKTKMSKTANIDLSVFTDESKKSNQSVETDEEVYIYDECGDTLWDKVLEQEEKKSL